MDIEQWWPKLEPSTRDWLVAHNGEAISPEIVEELRSVGANLPAAGSVRTGDSGYVLPDDAIDWIEAVANEERSDTE